MTQQIKWYYLVIGGVIAHLVPIVVGGNTITYAVGIIGDLCFVLGLVELVRSIIRVASRLGYTEVDATLQSGSGPHNSQARGARPCADRSGVSTPARN